MPLSQNQSPDRKSQFQKGASALFPYSFERTYPIAVRSTGVYIFDEHGRRYLDGSGGPAAISVGHSVPEVVAEMAKANSELSYAHTSQFHTVAATHLAEALATRFPGSGARVLFTSGGSEATESAIKIVRQYWLSRGASDRRHIISRNRSYHGATLGALGLSGNIARRRPYMPYLAPGHHIADCFCFHCPFQKEYPGCDLACAAELESEIKRLGPQTVAAFICEPVVGATSGAVPAGDYIVRLKSTCDKYGILFIADEVMTGCGRTGRYFAVEHWGVVPDVILMGKGLASGHAPLGAVVISEDVAGVLENARSFLNHSFTYQGHHASVAAGLAVERYIVEHDLIERARSMGEYLSEAVKSLSSLPAVGDVRGLGLMWTVEFIKDPASRRPFPPAVRFSERVFSHARQNGLLVYPSRGTLDGEWGDHVLIAPPLIINHRQIDFMIERLAAAVSQAVCEAEQFERNQQTPRTGEAAAIAPTSST